MITPEDRTGAIFKSLAAQERRVLDLIVPNRRVAAPILRAAGLSVCHFDQDDHRLIFAGWEMACEENLSLVQMLGLTEQALKADGLWDDTTPASSKGMRHSFATLARLGVGSVDPKEIAEIFKHPDGFRRAVARHVTALVDAVDAIQGQAV